MSSKTMTATLEPVVAGDVNERKRIELYSIDTIGGSTITANVWRNGETNVEITGSIYNVGDTASDPDDKPVIEIPLGTWLQNTATPNAYYNIEYEVALPDGRVLTWPNKRPDVFFVRAEGDA